ncbi:MAG: helix-turn-helix transcriptional regulator, partial [Actinomycetota bacterium]|nr:helix-turn-helix transcriptional regulator [Actinomycetota bacterium]
GWGSLTETEHRVATTVAEGLTNSQTGARLLQSRHTVDFHLRQIYRKLDISSRVQLTRLVLEHASEQADDGAVNSSASL